MMTCPVSIRGTIYPSQKAAAKALGLRPAAIAQSLRRNGHCDMVGTHQARHGNTNAIARPVVLFGRRFRSVKAASEALGISRAAMHRYIQNPARYASTGDRIYHAMLTADAEGSRATSLDRRGKPADNT